MSKLKDKMRKMKDAELTPIRSSGLQAASKVSSQNTERPSLEELPRFLGLSDLKTPTSK